MSVGEVVWPSQWPTELGCFLMTNHTAQSTVENLAEPLAPTGQNAKAIEFLTLAGFTLYGNDWIVPLAGELAISPDEIQSWLSGETPLTLDNEFGPKCPRRCATAARNSPTFTTKSTQPFAR